MKKLISLCLLFSFNAFAGKNCPNIELNCENWYSSKVFTYRDSESVINLPPDFEFAKSQCIISGYLPSSSSDGRSVLGHEVYVDENLTTLITQGPNSYQKYNFEFKFKSQVGVAFQTKSEGTSYSCTLVSKPD
jgi:hypothetical protein